MHILITGAKGQLGTELSLLTQNNPDYYCYYTDIDELDITSFEKIRDFVKDKKINFIINCAAYTQVDKAESEPEKAELINSLAVKNLALISNEIKACLIHISTDYVFNGKNFRPYIETDPTDPLSVYGKTKLNGENNIINICENYVIIRTSWLYSPYGNNFVKTIRNIALQKKQLNIVFDQVGTPTYAKDLAYAILVLINQINKNTKEIYHFSNEGVASWYDFAISITELSDIKCSITPIESSQYPTPAKRPFYSVLNKSKIKNDFKITIPYWKDSLKECLKRINN